MVSWLPPPPPQEFTPIPAHPPPSWPPQKTKKALWTASRKPSNPQKEQTMLTADPSLHTAPFSEGGAPTTTHHSGRPPTPTGRPQILLPQNETPVPEIDFLPDYFSLFYLERSTNIGSSTSSLHFNLSSIFPLAVPHHSLAFRRFSYVAFTLLEGQNKKTYTHLKHTSALTCVRITVIWWVRGQIYSWICMTSQRGDVTNMFISNSLTC